MTNKQFESYCEWRVCIVKNYDKDTYADLDDLQYDIWLERMGLIETAFIKMD